MTNLYPLKFVPIVKERIWGGDALVSKWGKPGKEETMYGESWEISAIRGDLSVVANGFLEGNNIEELIEVYMGDLVGEEIFEIYGVEFPLLIKLIDTREELSVQVHPDNDLARKRHNAYGKTELWYILEAGDESEIYSGFNREVNQEELVAALEKGTIHGLLNKTKPVAGDSYFIPAGTIHALGKDILVAEIQQTSDITYRLFDFNRKDASGQSRELHTDLALEAINYNAAPNQQMHVNQVKGGSVNLSESEFFTVNLLSLTEPRDMDYSMTDSFIIYICTSGSFDIEAEGTVVNIRKGETLLIPSIIEFARITPEKESELLEIYLIPGITK